MTEDTLIETLDPRVNSITPRWVSHELTTVHTISDQESLLYHTRGISNGKEMKEEVEKALLHRKSHKRPIDAIDDCTSQGQHSRNICPRPMDPPASPSQPSTPSHTPTPYSPASSHHSTHSPSPTPSRSKSDVHSGTTPTRTPARNCSASLPPIEAAVHDLLLAVQHSTKSATLPSTSINTTIDLTQDAGNDVDEMMPSSSHAAWPLKFVKSMSEGFLKMETMTGSLEYRFAIAFPSAQTDKFPKASYNINSRIWEWAPEDLCNQYITAGYSNGGRWKDFAREVTEFYDGKVPGKRSAKDSKKTGGKVQVKTEKTEGVQVKKEKRVKFSVDLDSEVIIIDDD
ncbi:hypothetical protein L208DRAFT_1234969 [Tricholoma matsutake]|nr:hypothetical protein L208DRAFT_1234969 [Tricholoma matsutake 945]